VREVTALRRKNRDFRQVAALPAWVSIAAMKKSLSREQWLLVGSGLAAVGIVTWVIWSSTGQWLLLLANILFSLLFLASALDDMLRLPAEYGRLCMYAMLALILLTLSVFPYQVTLILAVVLAASAPYHLSPRHSWLLIVVGNVLFVAVIASRGLSGGDIAGLLTLVALQGFAISSSLARRRDAESRDALARQNLDLQAARAELARKSQAEERLRIAGALHDTIGHRLTALQLQLEALSHEVPAPMRASVTTCKSVAAELLEDVRSIVRNMPDTRPRDFAVALQQLQAATPGVEVQLPAQLPEIEPALAEQLAYCLREGIHNAVRHGGADRITVELGNDRFRVIDNGQGLASPPAEPGFGLANMQQRLAAFGGSVALENAVGHCGCVLTLRLPDGLVS
jgi:signal transduction histidine kinase